MEVETCPRSRKHGEAGRKGERLGKNFLRLRHVINERFGLTPQVAMLQDAFEALEQMPTNDEIKKKSQNPGCTATPVKDLWQLYNLHKRVESCEGTIEKMASMIEDLVKETCNFKEAMMVIAGAVDEIE